MSLVQEVLREGRDPRVEVELLGLQRDPAHDRAPAAGHAAALGLGLVALVAQRDLDAPHAHAPAEQSAPAVHLDLVGQRSLEPDRERLDEGVEVAAVGPQRRGQQVEVVGAGHQPPPRGGAMAWIPVISRPTMSDRMLSVPSKVKTASMSAWWRATWWRRRIPLPPRMSRASATIARALAAWFILASEAIPGVRRSSPASSLRRRHSSCMAVISPTMRLSLSCTSWNDASGCPNCSRSFA